MEWNDIKDKMKDMRPSDQTLFFGYDHTNHYPWTKSYKGDDAITYCCIKHLREKFKLGEEIIDEYNR